MSKRTDPELVARIIALHDQGGSYTKISKATGVPKSTVRDIIKGGPRQTEEPDSPDLTHARANKEPEPVEAFAPAPAPHQSAPARPDSITKEETVANIYLLLNAAKRGFYETHKRNDLAFDKKTWGEVQYLKMMKEAARMMMTCSGLDKGEVEPMLVSPLDDLAREIEAFRKEVEE